MNGNRAALVLAGFAMAIGCSPGGPGQVEPGGAVVSVYTDLSGDSCTTLQYNEEESSSTQACAGTHGYKLLVLDGDARQSVTVIAPDDGEHPLDYWQVITGGFSVLGDRAEWRVTGGGDDASPIALIVPVIASEFDDLGEPREVTYLAVAKITPEGICVTESVVAGELQLERARGAADSSADKPCLGSTAAAELVAGTYCYQLDDAVLTAHVRLDVGATGTVSGRTEATIHDDDSGYYTSYIQEFAGAESAAPLDVTTWIEYDVQNTQENWSIAPDRLQTETHLMATVDCELVRDAFQGSYLMDLDDPEQSPVRTERLDLEPGDTVTQSSGVVRGERDVYLIAATGGEELSLRISALEDNAVFDVVAPSGLLLAAESRKAVVVLPHTGDYQIIVGGTRGNASYELVVTRR